MNDFNVIPNTGKFGNIVNAINSNFQLAKEAIDVGSYQKTNCLGFYDTAASLSTAHPSPSNNDWALVGTGSNLTIYVAQNGAWVSSGTTLSLSVDLTNYVLKSIYNNAMQEHNTRIVKLENDTIVFSPLYNFTDVEDLLIRYTASERGEIISQSAGSFKLRIYTGIAIGQHLRLKFIGNLGGAQAYAFYSTANLSEMGASTCLTTSTSDESNMAIKCDTAASNTYDIVVPDNAVALVITLYDPAIAKADVEVATPDVRIGESVEKNNESINGLTQRITNVEDTQESIITALPKKLTVTRNGDVVQAVWNDGKGHELVYTFGTIYPKSNQGYGLQYVRYRPVGSTDIGTSLQQQYESDMIGPVQVDNVWCGGAHRIELADKSLVRSIGNITKHFYANGTEILDGETVETDELVMVKTQDIFAPNESNNDVSLFLCDETEIMSIKGDCIAVSVMHNYDNSNCAGRVITSYYGMQTYGLGNVGDLQTMTLRGRYPVLQTISNSASSYFTKADFPHFNCFVQYRPSDGWCVSAKVNPEIGIGDHSYLGDTDNIFVTGPSKLYHRLIAGKTITVGMKYVWQGVYRFGHLENKNEIYNWIMDK